MAQETVLIFGKDACPYTQAALEEYRKRNVAVQYLNVKKDADAMRRMLEFSNGARQVPVIVDQGQVTIGYGGT
ncbi:MAG: UXX-star (seleno)protein family 1 [Acidobacteriota bacterium]